MRAMEPLGGRALEFWKPSTVMRAAPGRAAVGCGENLELALEVVGIVGELLDVFLGESVCADAMIGVEAGAVVIIADLDVRGNGGEGEMEVEVEDFSRVSRG